MESIVERISRQHFWSFHGGVHPPEQKELTNNKPIKHLALPKQLILPLQQHIGRQGDLLVKVGDTVLKGQPLTASSNPMAVPIHAPTSGRISAIKPSVIAHPSGLSELCIFIDVDGEERWIERKACQDITQLSNQEIINKIANAGIAGMGGAGFPTHIKVNTKPDINFLIINAAECEPYITADDLLTCEHSESIIEGIQILDQLLNPAFILIGIEDNKPKAIAALQQASKGLEKIKVCVVPTKYPTGGEKQLIKVLTGQEIKSGSLPIHQGIVMQNIATCFAINEAIRHDTPLLQRVVTVTGQALAKPQNVWALLGTPVSHLLEQCGFDNKGMVRSPVIMGGPMMGFSLSSDMVPIVKISNCILAPSAKEMPSAFTGASQEVECIRCGQCADVCPSQLLPQELQWSAKAKDYPQLAKLNLSDCIDCGACAYVCPSHIPLVQYYRVAKAEVRQQQQADLKAEKAKLRFEARKKRLEQEKIARELKHKKAAEARKAAMNKATPEAVEAKSAVAAALARVKAKKAASKQVEPSETITPDNVAQTAEPAQQDAKAKVAAAIARAKAKKQAQQEKDTETNKLDSADADKKAKIAAAVAKAKAKKQAGNETLPVSSEESASKESTNEENTNKDSKLDKKSAAIAKAKAKALAKKQQSAEESAPETSTDSTMNHSEDAAPAEQVTPQNDAQSKKAAIIAKAKAKALAKKQQSTEESANESASQASTDSTMNHSEDAAPAEATEPAEQVTPQNDAQSKKAAIIAKAKAKALAKKQQSTEESANESASEASTDSTMNHSEGAAPTEAIKPAESAESTEQIKPQNDAQSKKAAIIAKAKAKALAKKALAEQKNTGQNGNDLNQSNE
ncbi:electron transport complex subunit RsxC [Litorilituus sediminis]|uniref:Ion-translocating oxidoreductase complex subunit C n=1 Tax=Litorilituus sediminis TaxID=718192 RepID=A0A4P6P6B0_9GAMM|nr:electron transport complex subunit RsxC [Litorilituus sediminis]QBG34962.1 electron transport complex subunit RsxC [Litorilituus sediminis]